MHKILVAFRTKLSDPELLPAVDEFSPPANYKNEETISRWKAELAEKIREAALEQPYTATFDEVHLLDAAQRTKRYDVLSSSNRDDPRPVSVRVWEWLKEGGYHTPWLGSGQPDPGAPSTVFIGFDIKLFLKIFGIECSLPRTWYPGKNTVKVRHEVPLGLWFGNYAIRDLTDIVMPGDYRYLSWRTVLKARNLDDRFANWNGPHKDPLVDMLVAVELAVQTGLLEDTAA